jgi:hypothetical protein
MSTPTALTIILRNGIVEVAITGRPGKVAKVPMTPQIEAFAAAVQAVAGQGEAPDPSTNSSAWKIPAKLV